MAKSRMDMLGFYLQSKDKKFLVHTVDGTGHRFSLLPDALVLWNSFASIVEYQKENSHKPEYQQSRIVTLYAGKQ